MTKQNVRLAKLTALGLALPSGQRSGRLWRAGWKLERRLLHGHGANGLDGKREDSAAVLQHRSARVLRPVLGVRRRLQHLYDRPLSPH